MSDGKISSRGLLESVLLPHLNLARALTILDESKNTSDDSHRFQISAVIIFLAGIDKTLSLAFELLYLAGTVDWEWMVPNPKWKPPTGFIECGRGLTSKIAKLEKLGVDITQLLWLIRLRNEYVHSCSLYAGYAIRIDEDSNRIQLAPSEPTVSFPLAPLTDFGPEIIEAYSNQILEVISQFIDTTEWQTGWNTIAEKLNQLPTNPEPEYSRMTSAPDRDFGIIQTLNEKFVGDGAKRLLR